MKRNILIMALVLSFSGCATMGRAVKKTGMDKPENRFAAGTLIAIPGFIAGAFGFLPGFYVMGLGWGLGISGAVEGCVRQGGC